MDMSNLYVTKEPQKVFIDTNIIIFTSCSLAASNPIKVAKYDNVLTKLKEAKATFYVNVLVVSEFVNRWLRLDFDKNFQDTGKTKTFKKDYRGSGQYQKTIKKIIRELEKFFTLYDVKKLDDEFSSFDFVSQYKAFPNSDFNDLLIAQQCKKYAFDLLSDDSDFAQYDINQIKL